MIMIQYENRGSGCLFHRPSNLNIQRKTDDTETDETKRVKTDDTAISSAATSTTTATTTSPAAVDQTTNDVTTVVNGDHSHPSVEKSDSNEEVTGDYNPHSLFS